MLIGHPLAGVWIEISEIDKSNPIYNVTPLRGCGLKYFVTATHLTTAPSHPLAGVWIEISSVMS